MVRQLLADERVELESFPDADAYAALYPFLNKVVVPAGVGDLTKHRPPSNVTLLAPKASLVVRSDTHSAIQYLLLNTARQVHSVASIFRRAGEFPAAEAMEVPLSDEAAQFYKAGRPFFAELSSILDGLAGCQIARAPHPDLGRDLSTAAVCADHLRMVDATKDIALPRGIAFS